MYITLLFSYPCFSKNHFDFFSLFCLILAIFCSYPCKFLILFFYIHTGHILYDYTYLYDKYEFNHANHKAHSIKTIASFMNLKQHEDARRQCVHFNCCSLLWENVTSFTKMRDVSLVYSYAKFKYFFFRDGGG